jgi:hypothetical protein
MKLLLIGFIAFFTFQTLAVCQTKNDASSPDNFNKNVVYATVGLFPAIANLNYERQLFHPVKDPISSINLRIGYGVSGDLAGSEKLCLLSSNFIFGSGSSHFETDIGAAYRFNIVRDNYDKKVGITPIIDLGYRFQKKNGQFVFRTGIGWPDCIHVSLGFAL